MKRQSGIYQIQSKIKPERIYIGSAINITHRWRIHFKDLIERRHHSSKLQYHINKYGIDDLQFSIIEPCFPEWLVNREQFYMDKLKPYFNICPRAGSSLGRKLSEETKKNIGLKNSNPSENTRHKMREFAKNRTFSKETREKMSIVHKGNTNNLGRKLTEEQIVVVKKNLMGNTFRRGKKMSQESRLKISKALSGSNAPNYGKKLSEATKNKIGDANRGRIRSVEARNKTSKAMKGRPKKEETKLKMRDSAIKRWELRRLKNKIITQEPSLCN